MSLITRVTGWIGSLFGNKPSTSIEPKPQGKPAPAAKPAPAPVAEPAEDKPEVVAAEPEAKAPVETAEATPAEEPAATTEEAPVEAEEPAPEEPAEASAEAVEPEVEESKDEANEAADTSVAVPANLVEARLGSSKYGPMVLWALVAAKASGAKHSSGSELAELLNAHTPVEGLSAPNLSRALRSATLQKQAWLVERKVKGKPRFGLGEGWEEAWTEIFSEAAPKIG